MGLSSSVLLRTSQFSMAEHIPITKPDALSTAIKYLQSGCVIAVPTDTLYGLACDATNMQAIEEIYNIKNRCEYKPVAVCFGKIEDISDYASVDHLPKDLLGKLLPGPVTLILNSVCQVDKHLCYDGKIGIRIPNYKFIQELTRGFGKPIALSSANTSNRLSTVSCLEFRELWSKIPAVFDGGVTNVSREGSTVIDLSEVGKYYIIRDGVAYDETVKILKQFDFRHKVIA